MKQAAVRMLENEKIGQSAAKLRTGERSETIPQGSTPQATGGGSGRRPLG